MKWFKGSIPEAVTAAKSINGIFVVYVYDKSENSKLTTETLQNEAVETILPTSKYVAISIENGSSDATQFAQIYPLIVVPSLFFISGQTGLPLEVLGGKFDVETIINKVSKVEASDQELLEVKGKDSNVSRLEDGNAEVIVPERGDIVTEGTIPSNAESANGSLISEPKINPSIDMSASQCDSEASSIHLEERLERAKLLLAQKQELKNLEEIEEVKRLEIERRRQSHEMLLAKRRKDELERAEMSKQRKKDKEDEKIARDKVKAQIAADREERQKREALIKGTDPSFSPQQLLQDVSVPEPTINNNRSNVTRIKFRFPDNSSDLAQFSPSSTLQEVRNYLRQNASLYNKSFSMVATLPHRILSDDLNTITLEELGLSPSAIIIVKPVSSKPSGIVVPSGESFLNFFWSFLAPLTFILNYLKQFLGLERRRSVSPDSSDDEVTQDRKRPHHEGSHTTRNRPKSAYGNRQGSLLRREGNIHRLNQHDEDDEDENNTWNGNSTQQM